MSDFLIRSIQASDRLWIASRVESRWGSEIVVAKERVIRPAELDGFAAFRGKDPVGLLTYKVEGSDCEIVRRQHSRRRGNRNRAHQCCQGNSQSERLQKTLAHNHQ